MKHALRSVLLAVLVGATPALLAQHMGGAGVAGSAHLGEGGARVTGGFAHGGSGHGGFGHGHGGFGHGGFGFGRVPFRNSVIGGYPLSPYRQGFYNSPYYSPYLSGMYWWDDDGYGDNGQQVVVQQPPTPVVVQSAPAAPPVQPVKPASPLLIELQGDRFVRLSGNEINPPMPAAAATQPATAKPDQPQELPPVVLVFRDGHQQQVSSYSIIGPAIYASGSYWTNGYWTRKILLADLNLPATLRINQEHGVNFVLPSAPDQVVTRP